MLKSMLALFILSVLALPVLANVKDLSGAYKSKDSKLILTVRETVKDSSDLFGRIEKIYVASVSGEIAGKEWSESVETEEVELKLVRQADGDHYISDAVTRECDDPGCMVLGSFQVDVKANGVAKFDYDFFGYPPGDSGDGADALWEKFMEDFGTGSIQMLKTTK